MGLMFCNVGFADKLSKCSFWKSKDNWTNCFGKQEMANGVYEGHYLNGKFDGQGTFTFADGTKYVGEFIGGKKDGQGTFTWSSGEFAGDKYVGEYKDDKRHGQGTYTFADGTIEKGIWKNNELVERQE